MGWQIFNSEGLGLPFSLFGFAHLWMIFILIFTICLIYFFRKSLREEKKNRFSRTTLIILLLFAQLSYNAWHILNGTISVENAFPLNLCGTSIYLSIILLWTKNYRLFELVFFWGIGGATQAILTPDLTVHGPNHFRFYQFFLSHGLIVLTPFYMMFVHRYVPTLRSIFRAFIILNVYAIFVMGVNWLTGANYMNLSRKPETPSLLDFLGDWPYYIFALEGLAFLMFFLLYIPIYFYKKSERYKKTRESYGNFSGNQEISHS